MSHYIPAFLTHVPVASWVKITRPAFVFFSLINVWHFLSDRSFTLNRQDLVCLLVSSWVNSLCLAWQRRSCRGKKKTKKTAAKQDVLPRTPPVASAGLCVASLFSTNMPAGWVSRCCPWPRYWLNIWMWRSKWQRRVSLSALSEAFTWVMLVNYPYLFGCTS